VSPLKTERSLQLLRDGWRKSKIARGRSLIISCRIQIKAKRKVFSEAPQIKTSSLRSKIHPLSLSNRKMKGKISNLKFKYLRGRGTENP
jgi:hypothetical protein